MVPARQILASLRCRWLGMLPLFLAATMGAAEEPGRRPKQTPPIPSHASTYVALVRREWFPSTIPLDASQQPISTSVADHALLQWYNPRGARERDLNPSLTNEEGGDNERTVLELNLQGAEATMPPDAWAGLTQSLARYGKDLSRMESVEMWVNDGAQDHSQIHMRLHLDFGQVSEDAFWERSALPNRRLDTEDRNRDTRLDFGEDTGLDGLDDSEEPGYTGPGSDPNGDNYAYDLERPSDYSKINGTENNSLGEANARPDTEDLDLDGTLDEDNAYFAATLDLSDTAYVAVNVARDYAGDPDVKPTNGWRLFRIPVGAFVPVGAPSWNSAKHVRIWVNGLVGPEKIQIGGIALRGVVQTNVMPQVVLHQNFPNPFNPGTVISFELTDPSVVRLTIYDVHGRPVRELVNAFQPAGLHRVGWSGTNSAGKPVASGVYICRLESLAGGASRRMVLVR